MTAHASRDPLHGLTLEMILTQLVALHGWAGLGRRIEIRCFNFNPSIKSSLQFLRRTPWARAKVEDLYRHHLATARTAATPTGSTPPPDITRLPRAVPPPA